LDQKSGNICVSAEFFKLILHLSGEIFFFTKRLASAPFTRKMKSSLLSNLRSGSRGRGSRSRSYSRSPKRRGSRSRSGGRRSPEPSHMENPKRIWVGGLNDGITEYDLRKVFEEYGKVTEISIRSSRKDVFAFIDFDDAKNAKAAIKNVDQTEIRRCRVKVHWASHKGSDRNMRSKSSKFIRNSRNQLWVGHLKRNDEQELEEVFAKYGKVRELKIRSNRSDLFAFVEFDKPEACDDAIEALDQRRVCGGTIAVAWAQEKNGFERRGGSGRQSGGHNNNKSRSRSPPQRRGRRSPSYDRSRRRRSYSRDAGGRGDRSGGYERGAGRRGGRDYESRGRVPKGDYKLTLENLPPDMTWMDLKQLGKKYGGHFGVTFARTWDEGRTHFGLVEFKDREAMLDCLDSLDGHRINGYKVTCRETKR